MKNTKNQEHETITLKEISYPQVANKELYNLNHDFYFVKPDRSDIPIKFNKDAKDKDKIKEIHNYIKAKKVKLNAVIKDFLILKLYRKCANKKGLSGKDDFNLDYIKMEKYINRLKLDFSATEKYILSAIKKNLEEYEDIYHMIDMVLYVVDFISGIEKDLKAFKKNYYHDFKVPSIILFTNKQVREVEIIEREVDEELAKYKSIEQAYDYFIYNSGELILDTLNELIRIKDSGISIDIHYFLQSDAIIKFEYNEWVDLITKILFVQSKIKGKAETSAEFERLFVSLEVRYIILSMKKEME